MNEDDVIYFNNCKGRDHPSIFGRGAFFDLDAAGRQSKQALNLPVGQDCIVASYAADGQTVFGWYALEQEILRHDDSGILCRVFVGRRLSIETLSKPKAAHSKRYSAFFDVKGHFKRSSVIRGRVAGRHRPLATRKWETYWAEEIDPSGGPFIEGGTRRITVNAFERSAAARAACLQYHGTACCICGFDFAAVYGAEAKGYIHVHHLKPLSEVKSLNEIDPKRDLCPVCPNCHAVLHLGGVARSVGDVKAMMGAMRNRK